MKRIKYIGFVLFVMINIFFMQGCMDIQLDIGKSIVPPENKRIPIKGTWKVENYKLREENMLSNNSTDNWLGKTAIFDDDSVVFGEENCVNPEYKMKNVIAKDYFLYTYKKNYKDLEVTSENVNVISITSNEKHFYDFIEIKENQLIVYIDDRFYYLTKTSDETDLFIVRKDKVNKIIPNKASLETEPDLLRSGVVIGLRSLNENTIEEQNEKDTFDQESVYRTLWISARNRKLYPILENPHLLVPRKSGFWTIGVVREEKESYIADEIYAIPMKKAIKSDETEKKHAMGIQDPKESKEKIRYTNIFRKILFVGNDYIISEYSKTSDLIGNRFKGNRYNRIQILPMDNMTNKKGMKVSDIVGEEGKEVFMHSAEAYLATLSKSEIENISPPTENNFTLARRNGHWIMKGRLYYRKPDSPNKFLEFNINMIPPYKLVHYDGLHVPWNKVKEKVPDAVDVYTSPNQDLAIVITKKEIYVYTMKNNVLSNKYLEKIQLRKDESIVMAEWATGSYVEKWQSILDDTAFAIND
ncbi:hypothetical protein QBE52_11150 [Clostridiaceae bacterium 35-E11]